MRKKTLAAILSSVLVVAPTITSSQTGTDAVKNVSQTDGLYDNCPHGLDEKVYSMQSILDSVEMVVHEANFTGVYKDEEGKDHEVKDMETYIGAGTVIKKKDGLAYILTCNHILEDSSDQWMAIGGHIAKLTKVTHTYYVEKEGGVKISLDVVAQDSKLDAALLRAKDTEGLKLFPYNLGDSDLLEAGDFNYAVGYPLLLGKFVTSGIITSTNVERQPNWFMLQTPIHPGNSGGPIIAIKDGQYELVGLSEGFIKRQNYFGERAYGRRLMGDFAAAPPADGVTYWRRGVRG
ncbi:trypsin-like peptidase domain-containing protein [Candidatus Woesearchaeota archaeon]|nr:trypsin-like peptidase domain-containing protein [Candidatus Woesearchaeota archaeon]